MNNQTYVIKLMICSVCHADIEKGIQPTLSLANGIYIGEVPPELEDLTIPEKLLISRYKVVANIITFKGKQYGKMKGNCIFFLHEDQVLSNVLPGKIDNEFHVILLGKTATLSDKNLKYLYRVRRDKVEKSLRWLINHHPGYKDVRLDTAYCKRCLRTMCYMKYLHITNPILKAIM